MIEELEAMQKRIEVAIKELPNILNASLKEVESEIIQMNVDQQLRGKDAKNKKIGRYAKSTKKSTRRKGLQISFVDLEDTKNYHSNFTIAYLEDRIELASPNTTYSVFLDNMYDDLFGLTKANKKILQKLVSPIASKKLDPLFRKVRSVI